MPLPRFTPDGGETTTLKAGVPLLPGEVFVRMPLPRFTPEGGETTTLKAGVPPRPGVRFMPLPGSPPMGMAARPPR